MVQRGLWAGKSVAMYALLLLTSSVKNTLAVMTFTAIIILVNHRLPYSSYPNPNPNLTCTPCPYPLPNPNPNLTCTPCPNPLPNPNPNLTCTPCPHPNPNLTYTPCPNPLPNPHRTRTRTPTLPRGRSVPSRHLGKVNGMGQMIAALARAVGPALGGAFWSVSLRHDFVFLNFLLAAACLAACQVGVSLLPASLDRRRVEAGGGAWR